MKYKYKVKCKKESEYTAIKSYLDTLRIDYKQKEGKSLKVDCNKNELMYYLGSLGINPTSIKPCKDQSERICITGYRARNNNDGFGLQEDYDLVKDVDRFLPEGGIHCADDIREYEAVMRMIDPTGLTRTVYEHSGRGFKTDGDYNDYDMY